MKYAHHEILRLISPLCLTKQSINRSGSRKEEYLYFSQVTLLYLPRHFPYIVSNMLSIFINLPLFPALFSFQGIHNFLHHLVKSYSSFNVQLNVTSSVKSSLMPWAELIVYFVHLLRSTLLKALIYLNDYGQLYTSVFHWIIRSLKARTRSYSSLYLQNLHQ